MFFMLFYFFSCQNRKKSRDFDISPDKTTERNYDQLAKILTDGTLSELSLGTGYHSLAGISKIDRPEICVQNSREIMTTDPFQNGSYFNFEIAKNELEALAIVNTGRWKDPNRPGIVADMISNLQLANSILEKQHQVGFFDTDKISLVLKMRKIHENKGLREHRIDGKILEKYTTMPQNFITNCGDRFISQVMSGVEIMGILTCKIPSSEKKLLFIENSKTRSGLLAQDDLRTIQESIGSLRSIAENNCSGTVTPRGGIVPSSNIPIEILAEKMAQFLETNNSTLVPLEFETLPYQVILDTNFGGKILQKIDFQMTAQKEYVSSQSSLIDFFVQEIRRLINSGTNDIGMIKPFLDGISITKGQVEQCINKLICETESKAPILNK